MKRLKEIYNKDVVSELRKKLNINNNLAIPKIKKICINVGVGRAATDSKILDSIKSDLITITGQLPVATKAKKSISGFKLREGQIIGLKVTLRNNRMYDFLERLTNIVLPRIRDFRGISDSCFDQKGNLNLGIREQIVFPEIDYDKVTQINSLQIAIVTTAKDKNQARQLLTLLGFPFKK